MSRWFEPQRLIGAAGLLGLVTLGVAAVATVVLTIRYRPLPSSATEAWLVVHQTSAAMAGMGAFALFLLLVWPTGRPSPWRRPAPVAAAGVATLAIAASILTRDPLAWDLMALDVVSPGLSGYWPAAFDDRVRFLVVEGRHVAPGTYAQALVVHLVSLPVAAGALAVARRSIRALSLATSAESGV